MEDERSRRGLNPNAQAFVPNVNARPFIPGQQYVFSNPSHIYGRPPPPFPIYQQYSHMNVPHSVQRSPVIGVQTPQPSQYHCQEPYLAEPQQAAPEGKITSFWLFRMSVFSGDMRNEICLSGWIVRFLRTF